MFGSFVPYFARLAEPLNQKMCKNQPSTKGAPSGEDVNPLNTLNEAPTSPRVVILSSTGHTIFEIDACDVQAGCALFQQPSDETTKPIGYSSRLLTEAERLNDTAQRDCISIVWSVLLPRPFIKNSGLQYGQTTSRKSGSSILPATQLCSHLVAYGPPSFN